MRNVWGGVLVSLFRDDTAVAIPCRTVRFCQSYVWAGEKKEGEGTAMDGRHFGTLQSTASGGV